MKNKISVILIVVGLTLLMLGCQTTSSQRIPQLSILDNNTNNKTIYLSHVESIPRTTLDILAAQQLHTITNQLEGARIIDPIVVGDIANAILGNLVQFSNNEKDIQENTITKSDELFIRNYDVSGTNIENIIKAFQQMSNWSAIDAIKK
jgi:hypothetical protein